MTSSLPPLSTVEQLRERLATFPSSSSSSIERRREDVSAARWRLRERVVLLDYFDASLEEDTKSLPPGNTVLDGVIPVVREMVANDCEMVTREHGRAWRLRLEVRRDTLARLGPEGALVTSSQLDTVRAGDDDMAHRMALRLLSGDVALDQLSPAELSGVLRARDWLTGLDLALPEISDVQRALDWANVLAPLRAVAAADFVGRREEIELLEHHIGSRLGFGGGPLGIFGPGGMGKSTLLARTVLSHVERPGSSMLFAYLTFDRDELDPGYPLTLVSEICRQLALQAPASAKELGAVRADAVSVLMSQTSLRRERSGGRGTGLRDADREHVDAGFLLRDLCSAVVKTGMPVLLVLDAFEVAQRRTRSGWNRLTDMLRTMADLMDTCVVVAGRANPVEVTWRSHALTGLSPADAHLLLRRLLGQTRVSDELAWDVVGRLSGNPLSLRLAADLMTREGELALSTPRGRRRFLGGLREEQVQGILYRRILDRIDKRVRPLANPGLVVRLITADVIRTVLAKPCHLGTVSEGQAVELFTLLRAEAALVDELRPGILVHRADVRREVLPLLESTSPHQVQSIHRAAVRYYHHRVLAGGGVDDQTEHLYHRLMLAEASTTLDEHWNRSIGPLLQQAMPELPPSSRVYLASRLGIEVDIEDLAAADDIAWRRQATKQARTALDAGQPAAALHLLARGDPSAKPSMALHGFAPDVASLRVEALAALGRRAESINEATSAIADADRLGLIDDYVTLAILVGRVYEDNGDLKRAEEHFLDAYDTAHDLGRRWPVLTAGAGVLRIRRRQQKPLNEAATAIRDELLAQAQSLTEPERAAHPGVLRELAAEIGSDLPQLLADAAAHVGITLSGGALQIDIDPKAFEVLHETIRQSLDEDEFRLAEDLAPDELSSSSQGHAVAEAIQNAPDDETLKDSLNKYWQSQADLPSFDYNVDPSETTEYDSP